MSEEQSEEVIYKSKIYIYLVVVYMSFLLLRNGFKTFANQDFFAAFVLTIQAIVLYQIYLKHEYVKIGIKIWTAFPIVKEGTLLVIDFLFLVSGGMKFIVIEKSLKSIFFFLAAVSVYWFCDKAILTPNQSPSPRRGEQ